MALGDLAKQLAEQALPNPVKTVMDALRPPDLSHISEAVRATKAAGPVQPDNICATILGQVQAMLVGPTRQDVAAPEAVADIVNLLQDGERIRGGALQVA
jgi:hypothetical protein